MLEKKKYRNWEGTKDKCIETKFSYKHTHAHAYITLTVRKIRALFKIILRVKYKKMFTMLRTKRKKYQITIK